MTTHDYRATVSAADPYRYLGALTEPELNALKDAHAQAEMDRDYYRALVLGTWPDADAVIAGARAKMQREKR